MPRNSLPTSRPEAGVPPFFQTFQKEMSQLLDRFRGDWPGMSSEAFGTLGGQMFPALDIAETDDALEITAEVPGVKEDDLDVSIAGEVLTLKGEKRGDHEAKEKDFYLVERRYGSFRRQIPLGFTPDEGAVDAKFSDGVLKLRITKPERAKAGVQKIEIHKS